MDKQTVNNSIKSKHIVIVAACALSLGMLAISPSAKADQPNSWPTRATQSHTDFGGNKTHQPVVNRGDGPTYTPVQQPPAKTERYQPTQYRPGGDDRYQPARNDRDNDGRYQPAYRQNDDDRRYVRHDNDGRRDGDRRYDNDDHRDRNDWRDTDNRRDDHDDGGFSIFGIRIKL